jgi:hypothetical protein
MRNPLLVTLLILLALIPIAVWAYAAYGLAISYQAAEAGARKAGQAVAILLMIVLALTPAFIGGILMAVGAALLGRKPLGARVTASIGLGLVAITVAVGTAGEGAAAHYSMVIAAIAYVLLHAGLIVWLWRSRHGAAL